MQGRSPKRSEDGEEIALNIVDIKKGTKKTVIVELSDLEKEYLLIVARLNLVQFDKNSSTALGMYFFAIFVVAKIQIIYYCKQIVYCLVFFFAFLAASNNENMKIC